MRQIYLFDLDGTLANLEHRLHHITGDTKDWDAFYDACDGDDPITHNLILAKRIHEGGGEIWVVTGRSDQVFDKTVEWLDRYIGCVSMLWMRKQGDHRPDYKVKREIIESLPEIMRNRIQMAFEDRTQVVEMYRDMGIPCLQVAPGDF